MTGWYPYHRLGSMNVWVYFFCDLYTTQDIGGTIVPPASKSNHLVGHAIDMNLDTPRIVLQSISYRPYHIDHIRGGPNFDPVKYVKEVSHVEHMQADSLLIHPNFSSKLMIK